MISTQVDDDGRRKVRVDCRFRGLKTNGPKTKEPDAVPKDAVKQIFLEDQDDYSTLAVAQVGAWLDVGATFSNEEDLLPAAQKLLKAMRRERPRGDRKKPLAPLVVTLSRRARHRSGVDRLGVVVATRAQRESPRCSKRISGNQIGSYFFSRT